MSFCANWTRCQTPNAAAGANTIARSHPRCDARAGAVRADLGVGVFTGRSLISKAYLAVLVRAPATGRRPLRDIHESSSIGEPLLIASRNGARALELPVGPRFLDDLESPVIEGGALGAFDEDNAFTNSTA